MELASAEAGAADRRAAEVIDVDRRRWPSW